MPSQSQIIEAMQFDMMFALDPINGTGAPRYQITYQFEASAPSDVTGYSGWSAWSTAEKDALRDAIAHIETFLNVDFVEVTGQADADLALGLVSLPGSTAGMGGLGISMSGNTITRYDGFVVFDKTLDLTTNTNLILHELGHALGLDHTFEGVPLPVAYDNNHYSVMSYTGDPISGGYNDAMMLYDLLALQDIWGAADYNTGNSTYTGPRTDTVDVIWDTGGKDTFDASARTNAVTLDLRAGEFSTFGAYEDVAIAYGVRIENATGGSGDDTLVGNGATNVLNGKGGADTIKGGRGGDELYGGASSDTLKGGGGKDTLKGGSGGDTLAGGGSKDDVYGGGGRDTLEGGSGSDNLWGQAGADTFRFLAGADRDIVRDFTDDVDTLLIVGMGNKAQVLAAADEAKGHVTFDFGGGDVLVVKNMTLDALENDLSVA